MNEHMLKARAGLPFEFDIVEALTAFTVASIQLMLNTWKILWEIPIVPHRPPASVAGRPAACARSIPASLKPISVRPSSLSVVRLRASARPVLARSIEQRRSAPIRPAPNPAGPPFARPVDSRSTQSPTAILEKGTPRSVHPRPRPNSALIDSSVVAAPWPVLARSSPTAAPASGRLSAPDPVGFLQKKNLSRHRPRSSAYLPSVGRPPYVSRCLPSAARRRRPPSPPSSGVSLSLGKKVEHHITMLQEHTKLQCTLSSFCTPAVHEISVHPQSYQRHVISGRLRGATSSLTSNFAT
ncbi:hypothetical protein ACLOJK_019374 [Asimina triloba]